MNTNNMHIPAAQPPPPGCITVNAAPTDALRRYDVWLIFDDHVPDVQYKSGTPTLILSSPKPSAFKKWSKQGVVHYYLPTWTISEQRSAWRQLCNDKQVWLAAVCLVSLEL